MPLDPEPPNPPAPPADPTGWTRQVSGIAWAILFYLSTFAIWQVLTASIYGYVEDRLLLAGAPLTAACLLTTFIFPRPEGTPRRDGIGFGGANRGRLFAFGFLLTAAGGAAIVLISVAAGAIEIGASQDAAPTVLLTLALAALGEELFFRGYGFQQLGRAITPAGAAIFSGLIFGFVHGNNPEVSEIAVANTVFFGILFGLAVVWSRSFWLPYGMHLGWNLALAAFGAPISGLHAQATALATTPLGGDLWDGGAYGPEGGLAATLVVASLLPAARALRRFASGGRLIWDNENGATEART